MSERLNKTSICSVIFLDIVNQSKKPVAEQIKDKDLFNGFINEAIKDVAQNDRILLDTGDGAAIALLGAPEEALFIALTIRDNIIKYNKDSKQKLLVRIGINLGPVRVVSDINGRPNILGDGINVAERVMSFAEPNQILVSRSYYEITSRLTEEITSMFSYFGLRQDKHVREHEVYSIRSAEEMPFIPEAPEEPENESLLSGLLNTENRSRYGLWGGVALVLMTIGVAGFLLASNLLDPGLGDVIATTTPAAPAATPLPVVTEPTAATQPIERNPHVAAPNLVDPESNTLGTISTTQPATTTSTNDNATTEATDRNPIRKR
ncbi:MAG TPA: adenylate/guanylate cyclase domain-containing protein, partial [Methylophilaceae bacterium]|nr:adenylate/guanylate cyclase domain-containing protein [Methylophilaceae bacterium]